MNKRGIIIRIFFSAFLVAMLTSTCRKDVALPEMSGFPVEVGKIFYYKCSTSGCHNTVSAEACAGLDISSWENLFKGSRANSSVIPYAPEQSFLMFSVNTFPEYGPQLSPTMPLNHAPLSREEVVTLRDWIASGAPDRNGHVKWAEDPTRKKIYVANQGCDFVSVFDSESKLLMRCIQVGNNGATESPHDMWISPDGQYMYVSFYVNSIFQRYRTSDGVRVGELDLVDMSWHSMSISGDSRYALVSHLAADGKVALIDLNTMQLVVKYQGGQLFVYPHGCTMNYDGKIAYITSQQGNFIYKVDMTDPMNPDITNIPLQTGDIPSYSGIHKPYEVTFTPDYLQYYVTCQGTNEVRIFDAANDSLLNVISTTGVPQLMSFSEATPYLFVTCMEDTANVATTSSVNVINMQTQSFVSSVYTGYQPRGLVVDDAHHCVWIANRNIFGAGWAPHHTTSCQGRNGYMTILDMNTLQLIPGWKTELSVDPYCVAIRK